MDFELTKEQELIRKIAREFALNEFSKELAKKVDEKGEFPWDLYKKAAQLRILRPSISEEYGGGGFGMMEEVIVQEELTRVNSTLGQAIMSGAFGSKIIALFGTKNQKEKYLTRVLNGDTVMFAAFTEPEHGSDILRLSTSAVKKGDKWIINGSKIFITNAPIAEFGIVLCQSELDKEPTYRHQNMFIIETDMQGVKINELEGKMGQRGSPIGEVVLNNVELTDEYLVGKENRGFYQALHFFNYGRLRVAANAVGMSLGAFDRSLEYAQRRSQFGKPIIEYQAISHKLSLMAQLIEAARLLTYRAAWYADRGDVNPRTFSVLSSMAKCYSSEIASVVTDLAIQIFGGYGYMADFEVERYARDARVLRIYEGTSEILNNIIIDGILGRHHNL